MPKVQSSIVILMIIMAIVLGIGGFLILTFFQNRPSTPAGTIPQIVNDTEVLLTFNPENAVHIIGPDSLLMGQDGRQMGLQTLPSAEESGQTDPLPEQPAEIVVQQEPLPTETPLPPAPTAVPEKIITIQYQVQPNDSLYSIAQRLDTSIALMAVRGISATSLTPGQFIDLPIGNPAYCPQRQPYAVGEGDTAYSIGRRFGITAQELQAINGLDANYTVRVADIICVPFR